jgi:hypothetical protein
MGLVLAAMGVGLAAAGGGMVEGAAMAMDLLLDQPPSKYCGNGKYLLLDWLYICSANRFRVSARVGSFG